MRWSVFLLFLLVVVLQYPLWLSKGGWLHVWELERQVQARRSENLRLEARNASLDAEVSDLKNGNGAIEERARLELGLIRTREILVQIPIRN